MSVFNSIKRFVRDDAGMAPVAEAAVLAVGAIVLLGVLTLWNDEVLPKVKGKLVEVLTGSSK